MLLFTVFYKPKCSSNELLPQGMLEKGLLRTDPSSFSCSNDINPLKFPTYMILSCAHALRVSEAVFFPSCTNTTISFTDSVTQCAVLLADSALLAQGQPGGNTVAGTAVIILLFYFFHNHISDFFS